MNPGCPKLLTTVYVFRSYLPIYMLLLVIHLKYVSHTQRGEREKERERERESERERERERSIIIFIHCHCVGANRGRIRDSEDKGMVL